MTIQHMIDKNSPLWDLSKEELHKEQFEIIVILKGTVESTGMLRQVRTSYISREICSGVRLVPLPACHLKNGLYEIDCGQFHDTVPIRMLNCSAKTLANLEESELAANNLERDYHVNFTTPTLHDVPAGKSINTIFQQNPRTPVIDERSGIVKRKALTVSDRRVSEETTSVREINESANILRSVSGTIKNSMTESSSNKQHLQIARNIGPIRNLVPSDLMLHLAMNCVWRLMTMR